MQSTEILYIAWGLLAAFLIVGLLFYERTGMRLGGVLVLPLLLVYAILDVNIVAVFAVASAAALVVGQVIHANTFAYGRRLLYLFILVGMASTVAALHFVSVSVSGLVLALLPGIFAYNLHREGRYLEGASAFAMWFGILLMAAVAALWLVAQPETVQGILAQAQERVGVASAAGGPATSATLHGVTAVAVLAAVSESEAAE